MTNVQAFLKKRAILLGSVAILAIGTAGIASYDNNSVASATSAAAVAPAPIPVGVQTITPQTVRLWVEFSGRMHAVNAADIRPEVSGRIVEVKIKDGQSVKAGDVMFVIDPRPYEAAVAKAEANLASAVTNSGFAKVEYERAETLVKSQAIPQSVHDQRGNAYHVAQADILAAEAELKARRIDLDHAYVKAPITGRVSRAEITLGNLVQAGPGAPVLTSIVSNDGIYADFEVDEQTYLKSIRAHAATQAKEQQIPVELTVQGDEDHRYKGTIYTFDNQIDSASGTIRARAKFANEDGALVPGMFVSVRLAGSSDSTVLMVPEKAIGNDQSKKFVYLVGDDNKVVYHEVALGSEINGQRVVASGVEAGDRVIVDGVQHVRPNAIVQPTEIALLDHPAKQVAVK